MMKSPQSAFCSGSGWVFIEAPSPAILNRAVISVEIGGVSGCLGERIRWRTGLTKVRICADFSLNTALITSCLILDLWVEENKTTIVNLLPELWAVDSYHYTSAPNPILDGD
jgi:hypothetical protein